MTALLSRRDLCILYDCTYADLTRSFCYFIDHPRPVNYPRQPYLYNESEVMRWMTTHNAKATIISERHRKLGIKEDRQIAKSSRYLADGAFNVSLLW